MKLRFYSAAFVGDQQVTQWQSNRDKVWKAAKEWVRNHPPMKGLHHRITIHKKLMTEFNQAELDARNEEVTAAIAAADSSGFRPG